MHGGTTLDKQLEVVKKWASMIAAFREDLRKLNNTESNKEAIVEYFEGRLRRMLTLPSGAYDTTPAP